MSAFTDLFDDVTENTAQQQFNDENYSPSSVYIGEIRVDLVKEATPSKRWELSRHTIDRRTDVADHRLKLPDDLTLIVLITDDDETIDDDDPASRVTDTPRNWEDKADELDEFVDIDQVVEVVTPWKVYPSMMITGFVPNPDKDVENGMEYSITLQSIKLSGVQISSVDSSLVPKRRKKKKDPTEPEQDKQDARKGEANQNAGTKETTEVPPSWARSAVDYIFGASS